MELYHVLSGNKRSPMTQEEKVAAVIAGLDISPLPLHDFYVVAKDFMGAIKAVGKKLEAKSSEDFPKPFTMDRIDREIVVVK